MNSWEDAPWRGGKAGGYSRRPWEGDPVKGSSSKSVRAPPPLRGLEGGLRAAHTLSLYTIARKPQAFKPGDEWHPERSGGQSSSWYETPAFRPGSFHACPAWASTKGCKSPAGPHGGNC